MAIDISSSPAQIADADNAAAFRAKREDPHDKPGVLRDAQDGAVQGQAAPAGTERPSTAAIATPKAAPAMSAAPTAIPPTPAVNRFPPYPLQQCTPFESEQIMFKLACYNDNGTAADRGIGLCDIGSLPHATASPTLPPPTPAPTTRQGRQRRRRLLSDRATTAQHLRNHARLMRVLGLPAALTPRAALRALATAPLGRITGAPGVHGKLVGSKKRCYFHGAAAELDTCVPQPIGKDAARRCRTTGVCLVRDRQAMMRLEIRMPLPPRSMESTQRAQRSQEPLAPKDPESLETESLETVDAYFGMREPWNDMDGDEAWGNYILSYHYDKVLGLGVVPPVAGRVLAVSELARADPLNPIRLAKFAARQPMLWTIAGHGRPDTEVWNHRGAGCSTCRYIFGSLHLTRQRRLFACPDKEQHHCFKKGNALRSFIHDELGTTCSAGGGGNRAQCDESLSAVMVVLALSFNKQLRGGNIMNEARDPVDNVTAFVEFDNADRGVASLRTCQPRGYFSQVFDALGKVCRFPRRIYSVLREHADGHGRVRLAQAVKRSVLTQDPVYAALACGPAEPCDDMGRALATLPHDALLAKYAVADTGAALAACERRMREGGSKTTKELWAKGWRCLDDRMTQLYGVLRGCVGHRGEAAVLF